MIMRVCLLGAVAGMLCLSHPVMAQDYGCDALLDKKNYVAWPSHKYIVAGKDGWLFRSHTDFRDNFSINESARKRFNKLNTAITARGSRLVFAILPTRGIMHGDKVPVGYFSRQKAIASYQSLAADLRAQGLSVVIAENMAGQPDYFYRRDHHWSAAGARDMAHLIAAEIAANGPSLPPLRFITEKKEPAPHRSAFDKPLTALCGGAPPSEIMDNYVTYQAGVSDNLLGDMPVPNVVLLGTSNSTENASHANFDGFLKEALGADVLNRAVSGGGADGALLHYLASDEYKTHPPAVIVWEFPAYQDFDSASFLRQAIAAAQGNCGSDALWHKKITLNGQENISLMDSTMPPIGGHDLYIAMEFSQPFKQTVRLSMGRTDGAAESFDFKRDKFYVPDGRYFVDIKLGAPLGSLDLQLPEGIGGHLSFRICRA